MLPFKNCISVDINVSMAGIQYAYAAWLKEHDSFPTVLWVPLGNLMLADQILDKLPTKLVALPDLEYKEDWWSVGNRRDKGFGSIGAG